MGKPQAHEVSRDKGCLTVSDYYWEEIQQLSTRICRNQIKCTFASKGRQKSKVNEKPTNTHLCFLTGFRNVETGNDLFFLSTMREQPYELLVQRIKLHLAPRKKVIPQRCRFLKRIQLGNESVSEYLRELRHLAMDCTFGEMLEVMLRDRFVAGIKLESLQKKLLQEDDDVTLDRVFSIAVSLSEEAKGVENINTTKGLFAFKRLPYGVAVAPNKFQRVMDNLFADMSGVACYIDDILDILVAGKDHRDHEQKLELVFKRLQKKGLRLNKDKCKFAVNAVEYLGFKIDKKRLHLISNKIEVVVEAPGPTNKPIPICAASRIKRGSLKLAAFKYTAEFRKTGDNGNADALSRLPLGSKTTESLDEDQVLLLRKMSEVPFSFQDVAVETRRDRLLSIVLRNVRENNWQIPKKLRSLILDDLHEMHLGMVKMRMIARRYLWWPGIDKNIEELARDCRICQESANVYTKWLEIVIIKDITSRTIIGHLREIFVRFGLPEILVTDNGRQFVSSEFEEFTTMNGIRHTKTSPYNPGTNGLAKRYVREFKNSLRKNQGKDSIEINLQRFYSPIELFLKRGRIMELLSSQHYLIEDEGRYVKRHINQLRPVIKKEVPEVRDLVLLAPEVDEELKGAESSAQEDTPEPELGPAAAAVSVPASGCGLSRPFSNPGLWWLDVEPPDLWWMTWPHQASLRWTQTPLPGGRATCPMVADLTTSQSPRWTQTPLPCSQATDLWCLT
ncbi:K02A2.6-like [Cordylochernes scorpioides]|uniref:RNA-directed DNA polymerase n=1 Tax=Cordylochernes scorpioides TaxID=51811 RepID=A0ABY6KEW9_9ARAC|nr:K02A2.6-like [Cordylochernes scorpioides]